MNPRQLSVQVDTYKAARPFVIARGSRSETKVLTVSVTDHATGLTGLGECVPYARYGQTLESETGLVRSVAQAVANGADRTELLTLLPAGAARNAVDAALWDLEIKTSRQQGKPSPMPQALDPVRTLRTVSLGTPKVMSEEAQAVALDFAIIKLKLGGESAALDAERVAAVREAAPDHALVVDANESWSPRSVERRLAELLPFDLDLIEQPVAAAEDAVLADLEHPIPLCADESFHTLADLENIANRYEMVNLKLDKTGGLTHALAVKEAASALGLGIMVGCMMGSSLAMAPALALAQGADLVDLDGPYLLAEDRPEPLHLGADGWISANPACWG